MAWSLTTASAKVQSEAEPLQRSLLDKPFLADACYFIRHGQLLFSNPLINIGNLMHASESRLVTMPLPYSLFLFPDPLYLSLGARD